MKLKIVYSYTNSFNIIQSFLLTLKLCSFSFLIFKTFSIQKGGNIFSICVKCFLFRQNCSLRDDTDICSAIQLYKIVVQIYLCWSYLSITSSFLMRYAALNIYPCPPVRLSKTFCCRASLSLALFIFLVLDFFAIKELIFQLCLPCKL